MVPAEKIVKVRILKVRKKTKTISTSTSCSMNIVSEKFFGISDSISIGIIFGNETGSFLQKTGGKCQQDDN